MFCCGSNHSTALPRYISVPRYAVTAEERRCLHRYTYRHNCMTASAPTFQSRPVGEGMHTMTAVAASAPPKLPVWQTDRASYAIVARNLGQLVRTAGCGS